MAHAAPKRTPNYSQDGRGAGSTLSHQSTNTNTNNHNNNNNNNHNTSNQTTLNSTLYKPTTPPSTAALSRLATKTLNRKVARGPIEQKQLTPSEYLRVVGLTTMQYNEQVNEVRPARIVELVSSGDGTQQLTDIDEPLFQPYPSEVRFQSYNAFERYETTLTFRNTDKVAHRITVLPLESAFFKIRAPPNAGAKVAAGIDVTYTIEFSPDDVKDYSEDLICLTDREKFVVPLRALGARAVIDFPDSVAFGACVVKHTTAKTLLVRNIGKRKGIFSLSTTEPFSVEPRHAQLDVGQSMQVNLSFTPSKVGSNSGGLSVLYSTGEEVVVALTGAAEDANVRLEKTSLRMDSTFLGQICQRTVRINNRSDVTVHFDWKACATNIDEERQRLHETIALQRTQTAEFDEFSQLLQIDPTLKGQMALLTRTFKRNEADIVGDDLIAKDDVFSIEPKSGDIWPNMEAEVVISFKPTAEQSYSRTVYCDVTGRETRLPLKLRGDGVGARLVLECDTLDLGTVVVCSQHTYEIKMTNVGNIPASFDMERPTTQHTDSFVVTPTQGTIEAGESINLVIKMTATVLGDIDEDFVLTVADVPTPLRLRVRGRVVGPKLHFETENVNFGVVAFGFVCTRTATLVNDCDVAVDYELHLPSDCGCLGDFDIEPSKGTLAPLGRVDVRIDLLPLTHQLYEVPLLLDVAAAGQDLLSLPMFAECVVPEVAVNVAMLDFGRCFVGHSYAQTIELENLSELPAKFESQFVGGGSSNSSGGSDGDSAVEVRTSPSSGVVPAGESLAVAISMTPKAATEIQSTVFFSVLGSPLAPMKVALRATGQGAVLAAHPERIDWGKLTVLVDEPRVITVSNVSLIPAHFTCTLQDHSSSAFTCSPTEATLAPGQSCEVTVHTALDDTLKFTDTLVLSAEGGAIQRVPLVAVGVGSTIVASESLQHVEFGDVFSNRECERTITLTNRGRRPQRLTFVLDSPPPGVSGHCTIMRGGTFKKLRTPACPNPPDPTYSVFGIFPEKVSLEPGESTSIAIRGLSNHAEAVDETLMIMAQSNNTKSSDCLARIRVTASFVSPLLEAMPPVLEFVATKVANTDLVSVDRSLTLRNVSPLALTPIVSCTDPFSLVTASKGQLVAPGAHCQVVVRFNPNHEKGSHSRTESGQLQVRYKEHPAKEFIALRAAVSFPNVVLTPSSINFGCIVNNTKAHERVCLHNTSSLAVRYKWSVQDYGSNVNIAQVLDIIPTEGYLEPGKSQDTDVLFHGAHECLVNAVAMCVVEDGPKYDLAIVGRASEERFHFENDIIDVGDVPYDQPTSTEAVLVNSGIVALPVSAHSSSASLVISPSTALLAPSSRLPISIVLTPSGVAPFHETVLVQVANSSLQRIVVQGRAVFPRLALDLPRIESPEAQALQAEVAAAGYVGAEAEKEIDRRQVQSAYDASSETARRRAHLLPYLLDFGALIVEDSVKRVVHLTNDATSPVSFSFAKMPNWLTVQPAKVTALPPGESVAVELTMAARSSPRYPFPLGTSACTVTVDVQRGPMVELQVRGTVCLPTLSFSESSLDFGEVDCGQCKIMVLRLTNKEAVPVRWGLGKEKKSAAGMSKKAVAHEAQRRAMAACFEVTPDAGDLAPGKYADLSVRFYPNGASSFTSELLFNIAGAPSNSRPLIKLKGTGTDAELQFTPQMLPIGPCLPGPPGMEAYITVTNPGATPVEIYSLEYDTQYRQEEQYLSMLQCYDSQDRMLVPPRLPGAGLAPELQAAMVAALADMPQTSIEGGAGSEGGGDGAGLLPTAPLSAQPSQTPSYYQQQQTSQQTSQQQASQQQTSQQQQQTDRSSPSPSGGAVVPPLNINSGTNAARPMTSALPSGGVGTLDVSPAVVAVERYLGITEQRDKLARDAGGLNAVVFGHKHSGKSTIANALAAAYGGVTVSLDALFEQAAIEKAIVPPIAVTASNEDVYATPPTTSTNPPQPPPPPPATTTAPPATTASGTAGATNNATTNNAATTTPTQTNPTTIITSPSSTNIIPTTGAAAAGGATTTAPLATTAATTTTTNTANAANAARALAADLPNEASEAMHVITFDMAVDILTARSRQPDALRGMVVDGVVTRYCAPNIALMAVLKVLGCRDHFVTVQLKGDKMVLCGRQPHTDLVESDAPTMPPEMDEADYDLLTPAAQDAYNKARAAYKAYLRHQRQKEEEQRELEQKRMAEEEARLEDEKKHRRAKGGRSSKVPPRKDGAGSVAGGSGAGGSAAGGSGGTLTVGPTGKARPSSALAEEGVGNGAEEGSIPPIDAEENYDDLLNIIAHWDVVSGRLASSYVPPAPPGPPPEEQQVKASTKEGKKKEKPREVSTPVHEEAPVEKEDAVVVEKAVLLVTVDTTNLTKEEVVATIQATPGMPTIDTIKTILRADSTGPAAPVTLSVIRRPQLREVRPVSFAFVLVDKDLQRQQIEALHAHQAQAEQAAAEEDKATKNRRRLESRLSTREKVVAGATPAKKGAKGGAAGGAGGAGSNKGGASSARVPEDEVATDVDERVVVDMDDTLRQARWVVPANGEVKICVRFMTLDLETVDQTLSFETTSSMRRYTVFMRGQCEYSTIVRNPKTLFETVVADRPLERSSFRGYVTSANVLDFGAVLCGKTRDGFRNEKFEANVMHVNLSNPASTDVSIVAVLENDTNFQTFTLEPTTCIIPPGGQQELRIWAYPKNAAVYSDKVIVCLRDNPAPLVFGVSVEGAEPSLEVDRKTLLFERVLLHRKDTRSLALKNKSKLPIAWALAGLEQLGDEFSYSMTSGIIEPLQEVSVVFTFRSARAMILKKTIRIEVSDTDNVAGVVQAENIAITAEAFDVAVDINFPRNGDGGLDYEVVRVYDEKTLPCTIKNKGKYELGYRFIVDTAQASKLIQHFTDDLLVVTPATATLQPSDKPATVKFMFRTRSELVLQSASLIKCEIIEPQTQEVIAIIPISLSVRSVFSQYEIMPARGVSFGATVLGSARMTREIVVENKGEFEFRFLVTRQQANMPKRSSRKSVMGISSAGRRSTASPGPQQPGGIWGTPGGASAGGAGGGGGGGGGGAGGSAVGGGPSGGGLGVGSAFLSQRNPDGAPENPLRAAHKLTVGCFTITPAGGVVAPGGSLRLMVEADPAAIGRDEKVLNIDIEQRPEIDHPKGIPYTLFIEACEPTFSRDVAALFCEHAIVQRFDSATEILAPTFSIEDFEFAMGPVVVGQMLQARVRIVNPAKVACEVGLVLRSRDVVGAGALARGKTPAPPECFVMETTHLSIPSHEHRIVTIEFAPTSMQLYYATFEAVVEGFTEISSTPLTFDVRGEGVLPRVVVTKPSARNPINMLFLHCRRTLVGQSSTAIVEVRNDSAVAAQTTLQVVPITRRGGGSTRPMSASTVKGGMRPISRVERRQSVSKFQEGNGNAAGGAAGTAGTAGTAGAGAGGLAAGAGAAAGANSTSASATKLRRPTIPSAPREGSGRRGSASTTSVTTAAAGAGVDGLAPLVTVNDYDMNIPEGNALGEDDRCFVVVGSGDAVLIPPHQSHVFTVTFTPADARTFSTQLRLGVVDNDFEATMLEVGGEGYIDDLSLDGLDMNDRLVFAPIPAGTSTTTHCTLINHSIDTLRYEFAPNALVTLTPAAGHIQGGQQVQVTAVLSAQAAIPNDEVTVDISVSKINLLTVAENSNAAATTTLANTSGTAWNKDQRTIRWEVREDAATGRLKKTQIEEPMPEPPHCVMAGTARVVPLYCRAVCDYPVVELGVSEVPFRDTALLQTRSYGLAVRNPGRVPAQFSFAIEDDDLVAQDGACPFTVDPQTGTVAPGETSVVTLRYAPTVVRESEAVLHCTVANCAPSQPPLSARLLGASTRPLCHIALGDGTSSGASGAVTVGANESDTKVLEFLAVGLGSGVSVTKKFPVVNPTDTDYHFHWVAPLPPPVSNQSALLVSLAGGSAAAAAAAAAATTAAANTNAATDGSIMSGEQEFVCQTMHGVIPANSQIMMTFVFTPTAIRTVDRTWTLHIAEHDVSIPVQLIGTAREPRVDLATASINFGMVTSKTLQTGTLVLVNDEAEAFNYAFDATQMDHISRAAQFELTPAAGKIAPHSRQVVAVRFTPLMSQVYDFAIGCAVKRKHLPLTARIQADVFSVSTAMTIDVTEGLSSGVAPGTTAAAAALTSTAMFLTVEPNAAAPLAVDLGSVYVGERTSRTAWLANTSRQPVTYEWSPTGVPEFTVEPAKGTVAPQGRVACVLAFQANRTHTLTRSPVSCRIANGPTYSVAVSARAQEPTVELSTSLVNFDKVFVVSGSMPPYERTVSIVNREREPISLRPIYNGPDILVVNCPATLVQPGGKIDAVLVFTPRTPLVLDATVHFEINSRTTLPLVVKGNGVPLRLQLEKPTDRNVAFGAVAVGAVAERQVILVNKSVLPVQFLLTADVASLVDHGLSVHPGNVTTLVPKASCGITVRFAPTGRLNPFSEEIALQCLSQMEPLLHVTGCCQAVQVELDMAQLAFGAVAVNSQCSRRVLMTNSGDIGARFKWNTVPLGTFFTVSPAEGYISAGREVPLTFTFMPKTPRADVRLEGVACTVEGSAPLLLDLTAVSVMPQPEKEVVQFSTLVRQTETRSVRITNPTGATWVLRPAFDHEFFSGAETVTVEAGATRLYDIHYMPLAMTIPVKTEKKTEEPKPHTGTLFMALPDGAALVYTLVGTALPPRPVALPQREVPCKVWYTESIAVTNWLKRPQRFRVVITKTRADAATVFKGMDYLDVPAGTTKDYKMQFFAYKEGVNTVEILFRNEQTTEFVSYEGSFRAGPPGVMDTVPLSSVVRQAVSHTITLDNPLPTPVTFTMTCQTLDGTRMPCPEIHSLPTFRIPARSENAGFTFEFLPVRAREFTCRLSLSSQELGVFQYDLVLTATAAPPLPAERLRVCLGDMTVRKFKFINFNPLRGEYAITVDSEEFSVPATITTSAAVKTGTEVSFDIVYEPTRLGDCRGTMTISSLQGGEYICPIFGQCQPPRPAGPFTVRAGDRLKLPFKNVFSTPETFAYVSDNTAFSIKPSDFIKSKETKEILVRYDAPRDELVRTGRLTVSCTSGPNAGTEWIFYLRGLPA